MKTGKEVSDIYTFVSSFITAKSKNDVKTCFAKAFGYTSGVEPLKNMAFYSNDEGVGTEEVTLTTVLNEIRVMLGDIGRLMIKLDQDFLASKGINTDNYKLGAGQLDRWHALQQVMNAVP